MDEKESIAKAQRLHENSNQVIIPTCPNCGCFHLHGSPDKDGPSGFDGSYRVPHCLNASGANSNSEYKLEAISGYFADSDSKAFKKMDMLRSRETRMRRYDEKKEELDNKKAILVRERENIIKRKFY
jgi:hypothetical protein